MILLDTHAAVWMANNDPAIGHKSRSLVEKGRANNELAVSAISFWEIALLAAKARLKLHDTSEQLRRDLLDSGVTELPLNGAIAISAVALEKLHSDPADRFIVATAIAHNATLLTADRALLQWRHTLPRIDASK